MSASFALDAANGGRLSSLKINDLELIYNDSSVAAKSWGAYPMVPYAGRVNEGRFNFEGVAHQLEINHKQHAMHGIGFTSPWQEFGPNHLLLEFDGRWPLGGNASHRGTLTGDGNEGQLVLQISVTATGSAMPVMIGWHPWFNRQLTPAGEAAELRISNFETAEMYEVDDSMIPTGTIMSPPAAGPWDHPFRSIEQPIELVWESQLLLTLQSSCDHWVIYNRPEHTFCVEPQSGPPDIFNGDRFDVDPTVLQPGDEVTHTFTLGWQSLA